MRKRQLMNILQYLLQWSMAGLALAFVLVYLNPALLRGGQFPADAPQPRSYNQAVMQNAPAVVNVYASQILKPSSHPLFHDPLLRRFFGMPEQGAQRNNNLGSGVIVDSSGYLLTNAHVIHQADEILVTLSDGRQATAEVVGMDSETDLAVLFIDLENLPTAPIGDSGRLQVGDVVLAIGNPYDFGQTVTQGIVSATGRKRLGITTFEDFIQTDADINPGNSGGALISASGELVGINTAIFSRTGGSQGIGFSIPINLAINVMQQIIEHGFVRRGWLGVETQIIPQDMVDALGLTQGGVLIAGVLKDGPAAKAGIMPGDILTEINNEPLYNPRQAIQMVSQFQPETRIDIVLLRGWEKIHLQAEVAQRPAPRP